MVHGQGQTRYLHWAVWVVTFSVAVGMRLDGMASTMALQDSVGPYLAAMRWDWRAHAAPYGVALLPPYWIATKISSSLWQAVASIQVLHALCAPVGSLLVLRMRPQAVWTALLVGLLIGTDPGLIDTARSGAEGYFAALMLGAACGVRGSPAWLLFAMAVGNHPLALAGLPLFLTKNHFSVASLWGLTAGLALVGVQVAGWGSPGVGTIGSPAMDAMTAFASAGSGWAVAVALGPLAGLVNPLTRPFAMRLVAGTILMVLAGETLGYLRDHHLRLLTIPALACWACLPKRWALLLALPALSSRGPQLPPEVAGRPGTLGLVNAVSNELALGAEAPIVDRIWFDGGPAIEPAAVMLDLSLRGGVVPQPSDSRQKAVVVAAESNTIESVQFPGQLVMKGHGYTVSMATDAEVFDWSSQWCSREPKVGGAWDALAIFHPHMTTEMVSAWWACP